MIATASRQQNQHPISTTHLRELDNMIASLNPVLEAGDGRAHANVGVKNASHSSAATKQCKADSHKSLASQNRIGSGAPVVSRDEDSSHENQCNQETSDYIPVQQQGIPLQQSSMDNGTESASSLEEAPTSTTQCLPSDDTSTISSEHPTALSEAIKSSLTICTTIEPEKSVVDGAIPKFEDDNSDAPRIEETTEAELLIKAVTKPSTEATSTLETPESGDDDSSDVSTTSTSVVAVSKVAPISPIEKQEDETRIARRQRQVCFSQISIRRYPMTLGDVSFVEVIAFLRTNLCDSVAYCLSIFFVEQCSV